MQVGNCDKNLYGRHRFNTMARRTLRDELGQNIRLGHSVSVDKNKKLICDIRLLLVGLHL